MSLVLAALAIGATTLGALTGVGAATASPVDNLIDSTCSFAQLDRAVHAEHPDLAAQLDADPAQKTMLREVFDQPVPARRAAIQRYLVAHPDQVARMQQRAATNPRMAVQLQNAADDVARSCHRF
jgi:hemophore-related protein